MKFFTSLSLVTLSIGAVSGSTLQPRDLATIQQVLTTISQQVDALDRSVKSFSGDSGAIITASGNLLGTIRSGTSQVTATSPLNQDDALAIATYVTGLNASVATVVNDLISQKSALVAACAGEIVLQDLTQQKTESDSLAAAITSKVPSDLKNLANELSSGIANSLTFGINSFQGVTSPSTCPPPSSGPPPSSSAPSFPPPISTGIAPPTQPTDSFSLSPEQPSSTGPAAPALPTSSGSLDLPPVAYPSSSGVLPPVSVPTGGSSSPSYPSGNTGASSPASDSSGSSSGSSLSGSFSGSSGSYSGSSSSDTSSSPPKSVSSPPAIYTGAASASQVGTSTLAFVVGCIVLFM